jgi:hypothetical protein
MLFTSSTSVHLKLVLLDFAPACEVLTGAISAHIYLLDTTALPKHKVFEIKTRGSDRDEKRTQMLSAIDTGNSIQQLRRLSATFRQSGI